MARTSSEAAASSAPEPPRGGKPRLRGWIHAGMAPIAVIIALALAISAPTSTAAVTTAVFGFTTVLLFVTSAVYHRGTWSPRVYGILRRLDHSNIFLVIAGTYTPLAALLLPESTARTLLIVVWAGALMGLLARIFWFGAPRWFYVPVYVALGWVAVWFLPQFWAGSPAIALLIIAGGVGYTGGAIAYALKRPNPVPGWFGYHELFHVGTVVGYLCHAAAISIAVATV